MPKPQRLKYEKPVSIDMGRVAPILGETCSLGNGASDCPQGYNNGMIPVCNPSGSGADNDCRVGSGAGTFCWPLGTGPKVLCYNGSGFGSAAASAEMGVSGLSEAGSSPSSEAGGYEYHEPPAESTGSEGGL